MLPQGDRAWGLGCTGFGSSAEFPEFPISTSFLDLNGTFALDTNHFKGNDKLNFQLFRK